MITLVELLDYLVMQCGRRCGRRKTDVQSIGSASDVRLSDAVEDGDAPRKPPAYTTHE